VPGQVAVGAAPADGDLLQRRPALGGVGVGRATLCLDPALRVLVDSHRHDAASAGTLIGLADDIAALRTARPSRLASGTTKNKSGNSSEKSSDPARAHPGSDELINRTMDNPKHTGRLIL